MARRKRVGGARPGAGRPPSGRPVRSVVVPVRITPEQADAAREIAEREQTSLSDFGRAAFELAIARGGTR